MEPNAQNTRHIVSGFDALPNELVARILEITFPPCRIPATRARHDPDDMNAMVERSAALARLSSVSKRWLDFCDAASDLCLFYGKKPIPVRRRRSRIKTVVIHVLEEQAYGVDLPHWLPALLAPQSATLVLYTAIEEVFPPGAPAWDTIKRCKFDELVLVPEEWGLVPDGNPLPTRARESFEGLRQIRFGLFRPIYLFNNLASTLTTIQTTAGLTGNYSLGGLLLTGTPNLTSLHIVGYDARDGFPLYRTETFAPRLRALTWETGDSEAFGQLWSRSSDLEYVKVTRSVFNQTSFSHLPFLHNLSFLHLYRYADDPRRGHVQPDWTFDGLAEQITLLLAQSARTAPRLIVEVAVEGSLRKYDLAQRSAKEAFRTATRGLAAAQVAGLEVFLLYHPEPWRAYPPSRDSQVGASGASR
ncbi:hypothetical protein JCM3770_002970 [Rhodotorula araucariae]